MSMANDIANALTSGDVLLRAEPGAGKSTGLPLALLLDSRLDGHIILLEPRRLAARLVAERLARHLGENVGGRIGLRMRSDTRVSTDTQLTVVTEGVLTRLLQADPELAGVSLVIFDEFHERSLHADTGLALCLDVQQALRSDLRLLMMSATLDASPLFDRLDNVKLFDCAVRQYPVAIEWAGEQGSLPLESSVLNAVLSALEKYRGDMLVFLPGVAEISRCAKLLQLRLGDSINVHLLHSGVASKAQQQATAASSSGKRRVILSTSLAETSITIDGVSIVIDSGLERRGIVDTVTGAQRLETVMASQASAAQRAGRAGRTAAGVCVRLWSEAGHARRAAQWQAEIHRADLAALVLELALWGAADPAELHWLEPPPPAGISRAQDLLGQLGLRRNGRLTTAGKTAASLPVHPRVACMLVWARDKGPGTTQLACRIAVVLEDRQSNNTEVDLEPRLHARLSSLQQRRATQLQQLLQTENTTAVSVSAAVLLAQAFPDWIAQRRPDTAAYRLACGAGVLISANDTLAHAPWLVVAELGGSGKQLRIFKALTLDVNELRQHAPQLFHSVRHIDWDDKLERVIAEQRDMLGQLILKSRPVHDISDEDRALSLLAGIRRRGLSCLPWDNSCRNWQARVIRMRNLSTSRQAITWPQVEDDALTASLEDWLLPWLSGVSSLNALKQINLQQALDAMLDYEQKKLLDLWLPLHFEVPSGSRIALNYVPVGPPVLSVRLQEMLGCVKNPAVANGQIPLKLELLSPARRPVQITTDLENFWTNSYPDVKKEMAGRYPKHEWPDDPINALPTTRTRRRK